jgi:hypothetical protein
VLDANGYLQAEDGECRSIGVVGRSLVHEIDGFIQGTHDQDTKPKDIEVDHIP